MTNDMSETHHKVKGQATAGVILATALLASTGSWLVNHIFGSSDQLATTVSAVETNVAVLQNSDKNQDVTIAKMEGDIEYIRRSIEEQNRRQGITIGPSTTISATKP